MLLHKLKTYLLHFHKIKLNLYQRAEQSCSSRAGKSITLYDVIMNGFGVKLIEYNCTNESAEISELMDKYNIEGYPTIKLVKDNQIIEYDAKPTKSTMEQFLNTVL